MLLTCAQLATSRQLRQATPLPVVLWHGMGDSCCNPLTTGAVAEFLRKELGVFVHSIATGDGPLKDTFSSFYGSVNDQVAQVCSDLREMPELQNGFNVIGFSQGSQFLRAVVERCQHTLPKIGVLVSMGGQHQGIMNAPRCGVAGSEGVGCQWMQYMLSHGAYSYWVRENVIQAQYFKDPNNLANYLQYNNFLPDINNEYSAKNKLYRDNLASLDNLVLVMFDNDTTVVPRESAWFGFYDGTALVPLRDQPIYQQDWIGLKALDKKGALVLDTASGGHMQFTLEWFKEHIVDKYLAGVAKGV